MYPQILQTLSWYSFWWTYFFPSITVNISAFLISHSVQSWKIWNFISILSYVLLYGSYDTTLASHSSSHALSGYKSDDAHPTYRLFRILRTESQPALASVALFPSSVGSGDKCIGSTTGGLLGVAVGAMSRLPRGIGSWGRRQSHLSCFQILMANTSFVSSLPLCF